MTICIAAICDHSTSPRIVFCADRLVTDSNGLTYEQGMPKIIQLAKNCIIMMAGRGAESDQIIQKSLDKLREKDKENEFPKISEIVEIIKIEHQKLRNDCVNNEILKPRGLELGRFYTNIKNFPDWLGIMLDNQISSYDFSVNFLVLGFDIEEENSFIFPRLYKIESIGEEKLLNSIGFGIIGIGDSMSLPEITRETYSPKLPLSEALVRVYWAKKSAERIVSVGDVTTDIGLMEVVNDNGKLNVVINLVDDSTKKTLLEDSYQDYIKKIKTATTSIQTNIDKILNPDTTKTLDMGQSNQPQPPINPNI